MNWWAVIGLGNTIHGKNSEKALKLMPNLKLAKLNLSQIHMDNKDFAVQ